MRKVIRKRIRRHEDGLDLAVDFNADVAVNVGRSQQVTSTDPSGEERPPKDSATIDDEQEEREDT